MSRLPLRRRRARRARSPTTAWRAGFSASSCRAGDEAWLAHLLRTLDQLDAESRRGFAFNCLTKLFRCASACGRISTTPIPRALFDHCKTRYSKARRAAARLRALRVHHPGAQGVKPLVIFGAGDIAEVAHFYFTNDLKARIAAFTVDAAYLKRGPVLRLAGGAFRAARRAQFRPPRHDAFVALSYAKVNAVRAQKCAAVKAGGYRLATYVSKQGEHLAGLQAGRELLHPRGQYPAAVRADRQQRHPLERQPHRPPRAPRRPTVSSPPTW